MQGHAAEACRINTYGDSFTSCEQVSDGETWQEVLASHLGEGVRNFGIGGYSVHQAYLRMVREEARSPAEYIVFNIFDDDHYRNLHGWQRLRFGVNRKSANPPVPFVRVLADGRFEPRPNPCPAPNDLYRLCDFASAWELFRDDYLLDRYARRQLARKRGDANVPSSDFDDAELSAVALAATQFVVEQVEHFAAEHARKVLYVLSYNPSTLRRRIETGGRFDVGLIGFMNERGLAYVDLLEAHARDFEAGGASLDAYLAKHFIGHYTPLGNFFCAFAMKDALVELLDPPPPAYRHS
jgi:hypothetical protein